MIDRAAIESARNHPSFSNSCWLTFYLAGNPDRHAAMKPGLLKLDAVNLGEAEGGFVYAKIPVSLDEREIEASISSVRKLAEEANVDVEIIDLDSSSDVGESKLFTLWTASGA